MKGQSNKEEAHLGNHHRHTSQHLKTAYLGITVKFQTHRISKKHNHYQF